MIEENIITQKFGMCDNCDKLLCYPNLEQSGNCRPKFFSTRQQVIEEAKFQGWSMDLNYLYCKFCTRIREDIQVEIDMDDEQIWLGNEG